MLISAAASVCVCVRAFYTFYFQWHPTYGRPTPVTEGQHNSTKQHPYTCQCCLCVCVHVHMFVCVHVYMHASVHAQLSVHMCVHVHACILRIWLLAAPHPRLANLSHKGTTPQLYNNNKKPGGNMYN